MLDVFYLGDYFISHLKPIGDFFLQPFVLPSVVEELLRLFDVADFFNVPLAGFVGDFFRGAQGLPLAWVLLSSGIMFFVTMRFVKLILDVIPVL